MIFFVYCYSILLNSQWSRPLRTQLPRAIDSLRRNATNVIIRSANSTHIIDNQLNQHNHYSTIVAAPDSKNIKFFVNNTSRVDDETTNAEDDGSDNRKAIETSKIIRNAASNESDRISASVSSYSRATHSRLVSHIIAFMMIGSMSRHF